MLTKMRETVPGDNPLYYVENTYPDIPYCLAPIYDQSSDVVANLWGMQADLSKPLSSSLVDGEKYAQPFLCAYIKEVLKAVGYTLEVNQLEDTSYKSLYICQATHASKWCNMLPGWSVTEFMVEIERLFDAVFVIDNRGRKASLLLKGSFYMGEKSMHVQYVDDVYEAEVEDRHEVEDMADCNVTYKTDNSEFWRWHSLPDLVRKRAKYDVIPSDYNVASGNRIYGWFEDVSHQVTDTIYKDEVTGRQYLYIRKDETDNKLVFVMVDSFAPLDRGDGATNVELSMRPATFARATFPLQGDRSQSSMDFSIPVITSGGNESSVIPDSLVDIVLNDVSESQESKSEISLAFYTGLQDAAWIFSGVKHYFPISYIDEYRLSYSSGRETYYKMKNLTPSLRLSAMDELFYKGGYDIDFSKGIQVKSYDPNLYNARSIFEIRNKRYICKEMEFNLDAYGRKGSWSGTFYPIRISDTEADARWILTDGRWRDGGVWLDNGRWMDG